MKINKLFLGLLGLSAMVMASCSDSDDYSWASITGGDQVYFSNELPAKQNLSMNDTKFTIPVSRVSTSGSATVNISLTSDDNFLSAPSSVSFAAGESVANLQISYDPQALGYDNYKNAELKITDEGQTNAYGYSTYSFSAGIPSPYKSLGKGVYTDDYYFGETVSVTIMQNQENKNYYRVMAPYKNITGGGDDYLELTVLKPGDNVGDISITQPDLVYFKSLNTGYHHSSYDADVWIHHPNAFSSLRAEANWLYSKVIAYKEDGTPGQIQLAPFYYMDGVGGWNATQGDGAIIITFPGYAPKDLAVEIQYLGVLTNPDGAANAAIDVALGADVVDARAIVVSADADADAVADAIAAGDVEAYPVIAGNNYIPIEESLTGKLMVVVVILDDGAVKGIYPINFEYYGGGANPWESRGIGLYTEDFISSLYGVETVTYEVEIEENTDTPGLYRMLSPYAAAFPYNEEGDWDASTTYNIEVNATDPEGVYIPTQATGVDWGDGPISIVSWGAYYLEGGNAFEELKAAGYLGTLVDGIISLPVFETETNSGSTLLYQGLTYLGDNGYYGCMNGAFRLLLPEAVTSGAREKAVRQAKARNFEKRLKGGKIDRKALRIQRNRMAPLVRNLMPTK
jgi:hypothetical protein